MLLLQVWGHVAQRLVPLLRIGDQTSPALRLLVCESLGALLTVHKSERRSNKGCVACSSCASGVRRPPSFAAWPPRLGSGGTWLS